MEHVEAHVVCPHCLTEYDHEVTAHLGEVDESRDSGFMLCPDCLGISLFEITAFGLVARIPSPAEQQDLNLDPVVQAVLRRARRAKDEM
jgi:hypothetical protein